jgi:hypothetical protein
MLDASRAYKGNMMTTTEQTTAEPVIRIEHVRVDGTVRADKRFRFAFGNGPHSRTINNEHPTVCGAEAGDHDHDVAGALHLIKHGKVAKLAHWSANICPNCRRELETNTVVITRDKVYPSRAHPGPAWKWVYTVTVPGEQYAFSGEGLNWAKGIAKTKAPTMRVVLAWERK